jgi:hypothetical protein
MYISLADWIGQRRWTSILSLLHKLPTLPSLSSFRERESGEAEERLIGWLGRETRELAFENIIGVLIIPVQPLCGLPVDLVTSWLVRQRYRDLACVSNNVAIQYSIQARTRL